MPDAVRQCPEDGYFEGDTCPVCDRAGTQVLDGARRRQLSKFVSGALRHFPDDAGIEVDEAGWTDFESLCNAVERQYDWADDATLAGVIATDPKGRFERTGASDEAETATVGGRVRAAYGHSIDVTLNETADPVPSTLFHGTAPRNADSIREAGLKPMGRQTVHLSESVATAREVGRRHAADPVVFVVDAAAMQADDRRIVKRGTETYTTARVPPQYLSVLES
ncbi:RNA 2'-phosphotransferase [Haloarcula argentinensis]|uniref:Probable RNA 2'-phosphotransferase n=1 Tax=Haloarcula argentinensis TaxID=43776 RepID=A0ABU2EW02_HALAR|nr:RNA 2'-phosphotransferase [Haloarcula argentinensis]EMA22227.1 RNA 2'-phosphotransferase [Haloarcula argentinensis DSM 12282]MDS0252463.1 RNA 2'-phosphotransferase [Haloarcula argentinensis]